MYKYLVLISFGAPLDVLCQRTASRSKILMYTVRHSDIYDSVKFRGKVSLGILALQFPFIVRRLIIKYVHTELTQCSLFG